MVTLPPETIIMFPAKMAPARVWQRRSTTTSTYMPESEAAESGTSKAGPGPGPVYTPPATQECEKEQTCEFCGQP